VQKIRILFLGAGKRLSLLEQFLGAAKLEGVGVELFAAEISKNVPIAHVATIFESPKFSDTTFPGWLCELIEQEQIDIVIPNMDAATVSLSQLKDKLHSTGVWPIVSSYELCINMEDKILADNWFKTNHIPVPGSSSWPRILKPRKGFGGKSQWIVKNQLDRSELLKNIEITDFIEQEFVAGPEYSVDAYVTRKGKFFAAMPRLRLKVLDGEVDESLSVHKPEIEELTKQIIHNTSQWEGPITLQFIENNGRPLLIEINPRFGGGVTHSIHCGLNMPQWILREWLGRSLPENVSWKTDSLMTRCRRDIFL
jgi:carbamoyl-phosphate synthase large subunit